jgi:DNA polymerase V
MKRHVLALVDCNNFYVSCERLFNAAIQHKPVIVLSNNDSCVVARSNEVKKLGVKMGQPVFEIAHLIRKHNISVFSSNYSLYADLSERVMAVLSQFTSHMEVYSIDEAWLDLTDLPIDNYTEFGQIIKARVLQETGIPVSVGIAPTKSLSKIANELVKTNPQYQGVLDMIFPYFRRATKHANLVAHKPQG